MHGAPYIRDDARYMTYYTSQAGSGLPGFMGSATQYGAGLGGMFRNLFRFAMPLLRRGFNIATPHIKTAAKAAAKNIAGDIVTSMVNRATAPRQEGSGFVVNHRRPLKRPPQNLQGRDLSSRKRRKTNKCSNNTRKKSKAKRRGAVQTKIFSRDIF